MQILKIINQSEVNRHNSLNKNTLSFGTIKISRNMWDGINSNTKEFIGLLPENKRSVFEELKGLLSSLRREIDKHNASGIFRNQNIEVYDIEILGKTNDGDEIILANRNGKIKPKEALEFVSKNRCEPRSVGVKIITDRTTNYINETNKIDGRFPVDIEEDWQRSNMLEYI